MGFRCWMVPVFCCRLNEYQFPHRLPSAIASERGYTNPFHVKFRSIDGNTKEFDSTFQSPDFNSSRGDIAECLEGAY